MSVQPHCLSSHLTSCSTSQISARPSFAGLRQKTRGAAHGTDLGNTNIASVGQDGLYSTDGRAELLDSLSSAFPKPSRLQSRIFPGTSGAWVQLGVTWHWYRQGCTQALQLRMLQGLRRCLVRQNSLTPGAISLLSDFFWLISTAGSACICVHFTSLP